jgi:hypothetical protein
MGMQSLPMGKPTEGVILFENKVIGNRQNHSITIGKTGFQIGFNFGDLTNLIEKIASTIEIPADFGYGNWPGLFQNAILPV